jgi:CRISPR-associated protein Cmr1
MRRISDEMKKIANDLRVEKVSDDRITQTRKYKLITPLFGGGVKPRENDPSKLIRETSVRGQLRFWWRAMRGTGTIKEMKKCEDKIFGSGGENATQSKVLIHIKVDKDGSSEKVFDTGGNNPKALDKWKKIAYAAFALQPTNDDPKQKEIRVGVEFTLEISFPQNLKDDIEAALWAWETFGGIGGRTRRGFGALALTEIDGAKANLPKVSEIERTIKEKLAERLSSCDTRTPHLSSQTLFKTVEKAWHDAIEKLRKFRQFRRDKETNVEKPQGKSQWSEPHAIRAIHRNLQNEGLIKFPRAAFGLPIIFHFPQPKINLPDYTLNLAEYQRLASPLILKPIQCADGAVALALLLDAPRATELPLEVIGGKQKDVSARLTQQEAKQLTNNGLTPLEGKTDVLQAFLDFFVQ